MTYKDLKSANISGLLSFNLVHNHLPTGHFEFISDPQKHHFILAHRNLYMFFSCLKYSPQLPFS